MGVSFFLSLFVLVEASALNNKEGMKSSLKISQKFLKNKKNVFLFLHLQLLRALSRFLASQFMESSKFVQKWDRFPTTYQPLVYSSMLLKTV